MPSSPDRFLQKRYFVVDREQIVFLRFLFESYDGLLFITTLDRHRAVVEICFPPSRSKDAGQLLAQLIADGVLGSEIDSPDSPISC